MSRRLIPSNRRLAYLLPAMAALLLSACGWFSPRPHNLLLICLDTVRADVFLEPSLHDSLSPWLARAQVYSNAVTVAPWTLPTVATVFTGLYPVQHGAGQFGTPVANLTSETPTALSGQAHTLAETLQENGRVTGLFSAHPWFKPGFGLDQGFQYRDYRKGAVPLIGKLLQWLDALDKGQAYFAYLHLMEAHDLHRQPKAQLEAQFEALKPELKDYLRAHANPHMCQHASSAKCINSEVYAASILQLRNLLAGLLGALDERGLLEDTAVVIFSDHGEAFREHLRQHRALNSDPRGFYGRGHGQYLYQELLHVPVVAWLPGQPGNTWPGRVSLVDLFPTLLAWLHVDRDVSALPGRQLPPPPQPQDDDRTLYASGIAYGPQSLAVLKGRFKALYWPDDDRLEVFNLAKDPDERHPLDNPGRLMEFTTLAGDYLALPNRLQGTAGQPDAEQLQDLQAIGYLQGESEDADEDQDQDQHDEEQP